MELSEAAAGPVGPKVFVSYAHESDEHKAQVLAFATFLRRVGIVAVLDLWSAAERQDWYSWAIREMTDADYVLVVASERYLVTGDGNGPNTLHRGVQSETALLRDLVYGDRARWLPKILPVVLPGHTIDHIPLFLQPHTASRFPVTSFDTTGAEKLLRVILRQPGYITPAVSTEQLILPPYADGPDHAAPGQARSQSMQPPVAVRRPQLPSDLAQDLEKLAVEVGLRLQDENQPRQALGPMRLAVRWKQAEGGLSDHLANIMASSDVAKSVQLDLVGQFDKIAEFYRTIPSRRLVILGEQGSGKTTLAIQFVIDTLSSREPGGPVPVIVNIGSWNPASTGLQEWLCGRLIQDYPALAATAPGGTVARALVGTYRVLPVFDGFDEIAPGLQGLAMSKLNRAGLPLVLTSRPREYRQVVEAGVLTAAAVIQLDTLTPEDLITYLPLSARPDTGSDTDSGTGTVWAPVIARLEATPTDPAAMNIASALKTPLMVWLARTIYSDTLGRDPAELLDTDRFPSSHAIEKHLVTNYVPAVYRDLYQGGDDGDEAVRLARVRRWLRYLARHAQHPDTTDIAWWQLGTTMSLWARSTVVGLTLAPLIVLIVLAVDMLEGIHSDPHVGRALVPGVTGGFMLGLAYALIRLTRSTVPGPSHIRLRLVRSRPARTVNAKVPRRILVGLIGGFIFGAGQGILAASSLSEAGIAVLSLGNIVFDMTVWGTIWAVAVAASVALVSWLESPADAGSAASSKDFLKANRKTVINQMLFGGLAAGLVVGLSAAHIVHGLFYIYQQLAQLSSENAGVYIDPLAWLQLCIGGGITGALAFAVTLTAWGQWVILARWWLPLTGQLPWSLVTFLNDAHRRGVLRQSGPRYEFRHDLLQTHLANDGPH